MGVDWGLNTRKIYKGREKDKMPIMSSEEGQSTAEYALMIFWVMVGLVATMKLMQDAITFFCGYVVSTVCLPVP